MRGYPIPRSRWGDPGKGLPPLCLGRGNSPPPTWERGYPTWEGGMPHLGSRYPPLSRSDPRTGGGYPLPEQYSVYLLRGGRCASCVHAGGLSCVDVFILQHNEKVQLFNCISPRFQKSRLYFQAGGMGWEYPEQATLPPPPPLQLSLV